MNYFTFPLEIKEPWLAITCKPIKKQEIYDDILLLELDGSAMGTLEEMYDEFNSVFQFPDYFGRNFSALDECLTDLEWLPSNGYRLLIINAEKLLTKETEDVFKSLLSILNNSGEEWAIPVEQGEIWDRKGLPFYTVLKYNQNNTPDFLKKVKKAIFGFEVQEL